MHPSPALWLLLLSLLPEREGPLCRGCLKRCWPEERAAGRAVERATASEEARAVVAADTAETAVGTAEETAKAHEEARAAGEVAAKVTGRLAAAVGVMAAAATAAATAADVGEAAPTVHNRRTRRSPREDSAAARKGLRTRARKAGWNPNRSRIRHTDATGSASTRTAPHRSCRRTAAPRQSPPCKVEQQALADVGRDAAAGIC